MPIPGFTRSSSLSTGRTTIVSACANTPDGVTRTSVARKIILWNMVEHSMVFQGCESFLLSLVINDSNPEAELHSRNRLYAECFLAGLYRRYANVLVAAWEQEHSRNTRLPSPEICNRFRRAPCQKSAAESHRHEA